MRHLKLFSIKFIPTLLILFVILGIFYGMSFQSIFWISALLSVISYIVGDLIILRTTHVKVATMADFFLAFLVVITMLYLFRFTGNIVAAALFSAIFISLFEYIFHFYVVSLREKRAPKPRLRESFQYQVEVSKEYPYSKSDFTKED